MEKSELGVAVIGCGRIGSLRARLVKQHPAVKFLTLADRDPVDGLRLSQRKAVGGP